jgi:hypothetical protein
MNRWLLQQLMRTRHSQAVLGGEIRNPKPVAIIYGGGDVVTSFEAATDENHIRVLAITEWPRISALVLGRNALPIEAPR